MSEALIRFSFTRENYSREKFLIYVGPRAASWPSYPVDAWVRSRRGAKRARLHEASFQPPGLGASIRECAYPKRCRTYSSILSRAFLINSSELVYEKRI